MQTWHFLYLIKNKFIKRKTRRFEAFQIYGCFETGCTEVETGCFESGRFETNRLPN
jgi:hypothetical protein